MIDLMIRDEIKNLIENTKTYKELVKECNSKNFELDIKIEHSSHSELAIIRQIIKYIEERKIFKNFNRRYTSRIRYEAISK